MVCVCPELVVRIDACDLCEGVEQRWYRCRYCKNGLSVKCHVCHDSTRIPIVHNADFALNSDDPLRIVEMKKEGSYYLSEKEAIRQRKSGVSDPVTKKLLDKLYTSARSKSYRLATNIKAYFDPTLADKLKEQQKASHQKQNAKAKKKTVSKKKNKEKWKNFREELVQKSQSGSLSDLADVLEFEASRMDWFNQREWHNLQKKIQNT